MWPDAVNGAYELLGAFAISLSIWQLLKDKKSRGTHWIPAVFFTSWGYWNLFYYPSLGQLWSFVGAVGLALTNTVFLALRWRYRNN